MRRLLVAGLAVALLLVPQAAPASAPALLHASPDARGDLVRSKEYWLDSHGIRAAWSTTQGAGVTVAVIDTGIDGRVPELRGAVVGGADFSGRGAADGQTPVGSGESADHATMVASLLAGRGTGSGSARPVAD